MYHWSYRRQGGCFGKMGRSYSLSTLLHPLEVRAEFGKIALNLRGHWFRVGATYCGTRAQPLKRRASNRCKLRNASFAAYPDSLNLHFLGAGPNKRHSDCEKF